MTSRETSVNPTLAMHRLVLAFGMFLVVGFGASPAPALDNSQRGSAVLESQHGFSRTFRISHPVSRCVLRFLCLRDDEIESYLRENVVHLPPSISRNEEYVLQVKLGKLVPDADLRTSEFGSLAAKDEEVSLAFPNPEELREFVVFTREMAVGYQNVTLEITKDQQAWARRRRSKPKEPDRYVNAFQLVGIRFTDSTFVR